MFDRPSHRRGAAAHTPQLASAGAAVPLTRPAHWPQPPRPALLPFSRLDASDALDQLGEADAADHALLRLVVCAALATLALALASSLSA